jgi:two-component system sensor histidine kinase YesM
MVKLIKKISNQLSIGKRLLVFFLLIVVFPLLITALVFSHIIGTSTMDQMKYSSSQFVKQVSTHIDKDLQELDSMMLNFLWDPEIQLLLRQNFSESKLRERKSDSLKVTEQMQIITNTQLGIELIYLIRTDNEEYSIATSAEAAMLVDNMWYQQERVSEAAYNNEGRISWFKLMEKDEIILGAREVYDIEQLTQTGLMVIGLREEEIARLYSNLNTTLNSFFVIYDDQGNVISTNKKDREGLDELYLGSEADWNHTVIGYNVIAEKSHYTGWTILQATPNSEIMSTINKTRYIIAGILLIAIAILLAILRIFTTTMIKPIKQLMGEMDKVKHEDFNVYADENRGDEFGELALDFNLMVRKIKKLIEEDYNKRLILQEAEYKYLRAQINPHFIYNTLDSINWMAMQSGQRQISKVSVALGRLLRRSISSKQDAITVGDEIESIVDYVTIQKMRYGDRLNFEISVDEKYRDCIIPRSTLQPIVENALVHGIEKSASQGLIRVTALEQDDKLVLCVEDNGVGMTQARINQAMTGDIDETTDSHTGVGIKNVYKRIQLLFGESYGIHIESRLGEGTKIFLYLPMRLELNFNKGEDSM